MNETMSALYHAVLEGNAASTKEFVQAVLDSGEDPETILSEGMIAAMKEVGRLFEKGDFFVPEMLISARAMQAGLAILKPYLLRNEVKATGKILIGTVKGDLHDIGKNLVALMLEGAGFEVIDLGVDVPPDKFVAAISVEKPDVVALSALLTATMPNMKVIIDAITQAGMRNRVKVIVGGAPVTPDYAAQIGADGYSTDASRAVGLAQSLVSLHPAGT